MTIERHISQYDNPQEFTRLCNAVFSAKYGDDYQVIDGSREDGGNDGLVTSEKRILAMYCPMKPEQRTDASYLRKIRGDLAKAASLRDSGKYEVENWTFITPRKMGNDVVCTMLAEARAVGIVAVHKDAGFLALEIQQRPYILRGFPDLALFDAGAFVKEKYEQAIQSGKIAPEADVANDGYVVLREGDPTAFDTKVVDIRHNVELDPKMAKHQLRAILYEASDKLTQLNAIFGIADLYLPNVDDVNELLSTCEIGLEIAKGIQSKDAEAILRSIIGYWTSFQFGMQEMSYLANVMADDAIGMNLFTTTERQTCIEEMQVTSAKFQREFSTAAALAKEAGNPHVYVEVILRFANAAGQRAIYLLQFDPERGRLQQDLCKRMLLGIKDFSLSVGFELSAANALFNLANHLRFFGEEVESGMLLPGIRNVAERFGDRRLMLKVEELGDRLKTGEIPDYLNAN